LYLSITILNNDNNNIQLIGSSKLHFIVNKCELCKRATDALLRRFLSSDNSDRQRGVAKSIIVLFSTTQTHTLGC